MTDSQDRLKEGLAARPAFQKLWLRLGRLGRVLLLVAVVLPLITIAVVTAGYFYGKWRYHADGPLQAPAIVWLKPGLGLNAITAELEKAGAIDSSEFFRLAARVSDQSKRLKAGEYEIPARASMAEIIRILVEGKSIVHKLTIPEGLTSYQAMAIVEANPTLTGDMPLLPPEGSLLPETYNFLRGTTRAEIVARMQKSATDALNALWPKRAGNLPLKTPQEAIILASIVEKETGLAAERPNVAAVFINRLRKPMRLQSDPTIIYGVTGGKSALGRPILRSEIDAVTPYNTYQIDGLPPTPISNPGRASIEAVLNPPKTDALFFVADGTGGHAFSKSLSEHDRNVGRWRKIERESRERSKRMPPDGVSAPAQ